MKSFTSFFGLNLLWLSKVFSTRPEENFDEKNGENYMLFSVSIREQKMFALLAETILESYQNCILRVPWIFSTKLLKKLTFCGFHSLIESIFIFR